jgi:succinoglycan biosynthesis transport protein ExoP
MASNNTMSDGSARNQRPAYFRVLRERFLVIVLTVIVAVGLVLVFSLMQTPLYQTSAQVLRQTAALDQTLFGTSVFQFQDAQRQLQTGANMVRLTDVAAMVKDDLQSRRGVATLLSMVTVKTSNQNDIIEITAESPDPTEAASIANSFARQFIRYRQEANRSVLAAADEKVMEELSQMTPTELASERGITLAQKHEELGILQSMQTGGFELIQEASIPPSPYTPKPIRNAALALVGGLVLGVLLAFLFDYVDRRIKDEQTLEGEFGLPVLASVPMIGNRWAPQGSSQSRKLIGFADTQSPFTEAFRTLRSNLRFYQLDKSTQTLLITSALPQEGKTVTAVNLALSLALSGARVILMEADLRRPMLDRVGWDQHFRGITSARPGARLRARPRAQRSCRADNDKHAKGDSLRHVRTVTSEPGRASWLFADERTGNRRESSRRIRADRYSSLAARVRCAQPGRLYRRNHHCGQGQEDHDR